MHDGTYDVHYTAACVGSYRLMISIDGTMIRGMPTAVTVVAGACSGTKSLVLAPETIVARAGASTQFDVQARDRSGNARTYGGDVVSVQGSAQLRSEVRDHENGRYTVECWPAEVGAHLVWLSIGNEIVGNKPVKLSVRAAEPDASKCTAWGEALHSATAGEPSCFWASLHDRFGNRTDPAAGAALTVSIGSGATSLDARVVHNGHGMYSVQYCATLGGAYDVHLSVGDQELADSPFKLCVHAAEPLASACRAQGAGLDLAQMAGVPSAVDVLAYDKNGNQIAGDGFDFEMHLSGPAQVRGQLTDSDDGSYKMGYTATIAGQYQLALTLHGSHVAASPFTLQVAPGATAAGCSHVMGEIGACTAGTAMVVSVQAMDLYGNKRLAGGDLIKVLNK